MKKKTFILNSVTEKSQFNAKVDTPYVLKGSQYLIQNPNFSQLFVGLFKRQLEEEEEGFVPSEDARRLKFIVRVTIKERA